MITSTTIQTILNSTIQALNTILTMKIDLQSPSYTLEPLLQEDIWVQIGLTGDINGKIIIDSTSSTFSAIGARMFGIPIEGDMLVSFTGEFGNMFAGHFSTHLVQEFTNTTLLPLPSSIGTPQLYMA
ncbi:chemotaxis protein CheX [Ureibacillus composti]|nr:chemotaxis protein CheX [Ureibacillus composti]